MSVVRKIAKNTAWLFVADVISKISVFLLSIIIAQSMGDEAFGKYSLAIAFSFFFIIISQLGMKIILIREIAKNPKQTQSYLGNSLVIKLVLSLFSFVLLIMITSLFDYPANIKMIIYLFTTGGIIFSVSHIFQSVFVAHEKMKFSAIISMAENISILLISVFILSLKKDIVLLGIGYLIASIIVLITSIIITSKKLVVVKLDFNFKIFKLLIISSLPLLVSSLFGIITLKIDTIMLSLFKSVTVVGWYNASYQIVGGLLFIPIILCTSLFPSMVKSYKKSHEMLSEILTKSVKYLTIIVIPFIIIIVSYSKFIIILLFGQQFIKGAYSLQILMIALFFMYLIRPFAYLLFSSDKLKHFLISVITISIINVVLNLLFIPKMGHVGAALTTLVSTFIGLVMMIYFSSSIVHVNLFNILHKPILLGLLLFGIMRLLSNINALFVVTIIILLYIILLFILRVFDQKEISYLKDIFLFLISKLGIQNRLSK